MFSGLKLLWITTPCAMYNHPLCGHFFSGRCQMFSDVPEMSSDVLRMPSIDHWKSIEILRCVQDVLRCSQMITDIFLYYIIFQEHWIRIFWQCCEMQTCAFKVCREQRFRTLRPEFFCPKSLGFLRLCRNHNFAGSSCSPSTMCFQWAYLIHLVLESVKIQFCRTV